MLSKKIKAKQKKLKKKKKKKNLVEIIYYINLRSSILMNYFNKVTYNHYYINIIKFTKTHLNNLRNY